MGDQVNDRGSVYGTSLLAIGAWLFYGWALVPVEHQAQVWNLSGSLARLVLLGAVIWCVRRRFVLLVGAWWAAEELMVAGCSLLFIWRPWVIQPGDAQCYALLQFDIGKAGLLAIVLLLAIVSTLTGSKCK
jgi:hypothetical protein